MRAVSIGKLINTHQHLCISYRPKHILLYRQHGCNVMFTVRESDHSNAGNFTHISVVLCLKALLRIWKPLGSNLDWKKCYYDRVFTVLVDSSTRTPRSRVRPFNKLTTHSRPVGCCLRRWGENTSLNSLHKRVYCSSPR
jgi:hypothetical protein